MTRASSGASVSSARSSSHTSLSPMPSGWSPNAQAQAAYAEGHVTKRGRKTTCAARLKRTQRADTSRVAKGNRSLHHRVPETRSLSERGQRSPFSEARLARRGVECRGGGVKAGLTAVRACSATQPHSQHGAVWHHRGMLEIFRPSRQRGFSALRSSVEPGSGRGLARNGGYPLSDCRE